MSTRQAHIDKLPGLSHPATQQVSREEIVRLYYGFALSTGGGALLPGRTRSNFVFEPLWKDRP